MIKNLYYVGDIYKVGGTTTHIYQLAKKYYNQIDLVVMYRNANYQQLERLSKYVLCIQYDPKKTYECEKAFFNYDISAIENINAKEYIEVIHANYKYQNITPHTHEKITKYIGVSKLVCETYKEVANVNTELCYNPFTQEQGKRVLNLMTACRMNDKVKGKDRMVKFAKMLDRAKIPYIWLIFTDTKKDIDNPRMIYMPSQLDLSDYYKWANYYVSMSETEGYSYSLIEALTQQTALIVVDIPVLKEMGVNEDNAFILDKELSNVPIREIYNTHLKFDYKLNDDHWLDYFAKGKSKYVRKELNMVRIRATKNWTYTDKEKMINGKSQFRTKDEEWDVSEERLKELQASPVKDCFEIVAPIVEEATPKVETKKAVKKKVVKKSAK